MKIYKFKCGFKDINKWEISFTFTVIANDLRSASIRAEELKLKFVKENSWMFAFQFVDMVVEDEKVISIGQLM